MTIEDEIEDGETYYDLFLRKWRDVSEVLQENIPSSSPLYALVTNATPSRVIYAVDYFSQMIVAAEEKGVSAEFAIKKVLLNFGAPSVFCEGGNLGRVVAAIQDLRKILEACRKE